MKVWQQTACTARTYTAHCTRIISEAQIYVIKIALIHLKQTLLVFGPDRPTQLVSAVTDKAVAPVSRSTTVVISGCQNSSSIANGIVLVLQGRHLHHLVISVRSTTVVFTDSSVTECCRLANSNRHFERQPRRSIKSPKSLIACTSV